MMATAVVACAFLWWLADAGNYFATSDQLLQRAEAALRAGNSRRAVSLCEWVLRRDPDLPRGLRLAAQAASAAGNKAAALGFLERVAEGADSMVDDWIQAADLSLELGRLAAAEQCCRSALARDSDSVEAAHKLVFLLRIESRNWEARLLIQELMSRGQAQPDHIYILGMSDWVWLDNRESQFLSYCLQSQPDDPLPQLGQIRQAMFREEFEQAARDLPRVVNANPQLVEAQVALGEALLQTRPADEFLAWHRQLPANAVEHPQLWYLRGRWLSRQGNVPEAIRCFGEVVCRNPDHRAANFQLSQLLRNTTDASAAESLGDRALQLSRVEFLVREVQVTPALLPELSAELESLGRHREAVEWARQTLRRNANTSWAADVVQRLESHLTTDTPLTLQAKSPCAALDWSAYPLPGESDFSSSVATVAAESNAESNSSIAFENSTAAAGIDFQYDNGANPGAGRAFMFEFSGGGVAVLDYDADGWPDLHLTQGGRWPVVAGARTPTDRLFRNQGTNTISDVTIHAGVNDDRFSQGGTVGDYDNDGFPDLYVTNIGPNRFLHNNGDGTFTDVTESTGTAGQEWSLSCALADVNADGLPDLYVVNYLSGDVLRRACDHKGRPVQCFPSSFPAEQDRLYLNEGDGRFRDVTSECGIEVPHGKGMGLVIADFDGSRKPGIFVANDTTPNFLFRNQSQSPDETLSFVETGLLSGVAVSDEGQAQSSMGIAFGDANGDGSPDLFVTNYIREPSNLFLQRDDHLFVDEAASSGLRDPSLDLMKWGAQFLDADLDGELDLIVANGHLDDYSWEGVPFRMPTQCFLNIGHGRFRELPQRQLGSYFQTRVLGRAIARCDWNRDGLEDVCITHVDAPFALLSNQSATAGHFLKLSLRGVTSSRDAITAIVRVEVGGRTIVRQLAAGDGFVASNERTLVFGLGPSDRADSVTVTWPAGTEQRFENVAGDREWLIVEGHNEPRQMHPATDAK
jgi:tetratricopeptide (TPR) repeat protein